MTDAPRNMDELRAIKDPEQRANAATAYIEAGEEKIREARRIRAEDIRALVKKHGLAETSRRLNLNLSTVKAIRGQA